MFGKFISLDEDILRKNRIPILIEEPDWVKLFGDIDNKSIQNSKDELVQLITREKVLESYFKKIHQKKKKHMKMILEISDVINNEDNNYREKNLDLLDKYKEEIIQINEEIEKIKFELENFPKEIREANFQLLNATVQYGYDELTNKEKEYNKAIIEIDILRTKLREVLKIKYDNEEWINETYTFLHGILGSEVIEKLDRKKLK